MKKMLFKCVFVLACCVWPLLFLNNMGQVYAEVDDYSHQREMRAAWVATVHNLHLPKDLNEESFTQWADEITTELLNLNFNTIIFQVRPMGDALYNSQIVPISHFLTGSEQGEPISYDALDILLNISHSKGLEFHAWLNPYRLTVSNFELNNLNADNIAVKNPDWVIERNGQYYLDPGNPKVIEHLVDVVGELVNNYDIDAVHFDDYFYPGNDFNDEHTFKTFGKDWDNIDDWRRNNVNTTIQLVYEKIKETKNWVQFGVSPFGIWRNEASDPSGSATSGNQSYDSMYADTREWIRRGIIDYVTPQVYWSDKSKAANFKILNDWWADQIKTYAINSPVNLYIGTADYKVNNDSDAAWSDAMQLPLQIEYNRANPLIKGQMHYAVSSIFDNQLGYMDIIKQKFYNTMALTPSVYWNDDTVPNPPQSVTISDLHNGVQLNIGHDGQNIRRYVVYRFNEDENIDFKNENMLGVVFNTAQNTNTFFDAHALTGNKYTYAVKSVSPTGVLSENALLIPHLVGSEQSVNLNPDEKKVEIVNEEYAVLDDFVKDAWFQPNTIFVSVDKQKVKGDDHYMILLKGEHIGGIYKGELYVKEPYTMREQFSISSNGIIEISALVGGKFILEPGDILSVQLTDGTPQNIGSVVKKTDAFVFK